MKPLKKNRIKTHNTWRKRYKCSKTKSDHDYVLVYGHWFKLGPFNMVYADYECIACGKESVKVVK